MVTLNLLNHKSNRSHNFKSQAYTIQKTNLMSEYRFHVLSRVYPSSLTNVVRNQHRRRRRPRRPGSETADRPAGGRGCSIYQRSWMPGWLDLSWASHLVSPWAQFGWDPIPRRKPKVQPSRMGAAAAHHRTRPPPQHLGGSVRTHSRLRPRAMRRDPTFLSPCAYA